MPARVAAVRTTAVVVVVERVAKTSVDYGAVSLEHLRYRALLVQGETNFQGCLLIT